MDNLHINKIEKYTLDNSVSNKESSEDFKNKVINKVAVIDDNKNNNINKEEEILNFNFNNSKENEINNLNEEDNIKLKSKKININLHFNNERDENKNIINNKYTDFINKTSISFPKKPSLSNLKKIDLKKGDDEPYFTESNFNTNNNINIPLEICDNSTKISGSTNIKSLTLSQLEDKNITNNEESIQDSSKILINLLNKTTNNIPKENKNADLPVDINNKIIYNFEGHLKNEIKSRNVKKIKIKNKSQDSNYNFLLKNDIINEKIIIHENKSYDDTFFKDDFNLFKDKNKLNSKHINIIANQDNDNNDVQILKIFPNFKFNNTNFSKNINYKNNFYNDPKYMYIENYHDNNKVHKSKIFDFRSKKMI